MLIFTFKCERIIYQGLIEAKSDNGKPCLGALNLGTQIKVIKKIEKQTQLVPSSSLMYCNN